MEFQATLIINVPDDVYLKIQEESLEKTGGTVEFRDVVENHLQDYLAREFDAESEIVEWEAYDD